MLLGRLVVKTSFNLRYYCKYITFSEVNIHLFHQHTHTQAQNCYERQKWFRQLTESSANCNISISLSPFQIPFTLRATPTLPFQYCTGKRQALETGNPILFWGEWVAGIVELRGEISLKYSKRAKCLNTYVAHCAHGLAFFILSLCFENQ